MKKLSVPYISQWDDEAKASKNDCGPTSLAMVLRFYGKSITSDEVFKLSEAGKGYVTFQQLARVAKMYGYDGNIIRSAKNKTLIELLDKDIPVIVVVHYGSLSHNQDKFTGPHIMCVVGYDGSNFLVHDPDFQGPERLGGRYRKIPYTEFGNAWFSSSLDGNSPNTMLVLQKANLTPQNPKAEESEKVEQPQNELDFMAINLDDDFSSEVESKYDLKVIKNYDNHMNFKDFVELVKSKDAQLNAQTAELQDLRLKSADSMKPLSRTINSITEVLDSNGLNVSPELPLSDRIDFICKDYRRLLDGQPAKPEITFKDVFELAKKLFKK